MIRKKINLILLILLICQVLLIAFLYLPSGEKGQPVVELVPGLTAGTVAELSITDVTGKTLSLKKENDGNWLIDDGSPDMFPADAGQIQHIITNLTSLQSQRLVTRTRSSHIRLQVDDKVFVKKIVLKAKDGKTQTLLLGSSSGPQTIHVRPQSTDNVYLARGISTWNLDTHKESWWQKLYVQVDRNRLQELTLKNSHGSFTLRKDGEKWQVSGDESQQEPEPAALDNFLQKVTHIVINSYLGKQYQGKPLDTAVLTLTTDKETVTVNIGPKESGEDDDHIFKSSASPFFATAGSFQIDPLTGMKKEDFYNKGEEKEQQ
ncbi:MAG: DUF4340 domain-containing protein [Proteobacteria bacterium]|nr:DUF4340 domain-containing protein [Pseudomonadota bacterium]MBU4297431.1 DUF4340 domain-containing protein [Pseudomonadota bacterium]MCG2746062.1 DUF4340 domain-containing protein [Desulfobulbaceae bacterium]